MQIVLLDAKTLGDIPNLKALEKWGSVTYYQTTQPEQTLARIKDADVVVTNKVVLDQSIIEQATRLQLICVAATGTNNIDKAAAEKRGIPVKNAVDYSTPSVAQCTFAMLFQLMMTIPYFDQYVKDGSYAASDIFTHFGRGFHELAGQRFGIIGLGNIGRRVAQIADAFGADVVYYSASGQNTQQPYTRLELAEFLSTCDIISIHAPLNEYTTNLIQYERLKQMKKTALLINVGRGGIVHEADLAKALDEQIIAGAGIDVFGQEPIGADNPLLRITRKEALVMTPHLAWASIEARVRLMEKISQNVGEFVNQRA